MKTKTIIVIVVILIIAAAAMVAVYIYRSSQGNIESADSIRLGFVGGEAAVEIYVADEIGFFTANGIKVTLHPFETGLAAYNAMLDGKLDIAGPTEYVIAGAVLRREKIKAIAAVVTADLFSILGRKDHGIEKVTNLAGKRIGLAQNTIAEFYLGRFLSLQGMSIRDVTLVNMGYSAAVEAIRKGSVSTVITIPPFSDSIKSTLGDGVVEWPAQSSQWIYGVLISTDVWINKNPDLIVRLLKAIDQANMFIAQHPQEAMTIVKKRLKLDAATIEKAWLRNHFVLSLDQGLISAMDDEARFLIRNKLTKERTIPDFTRYIYTDGLKALKPEAVNIIGR